MPACRSPITCRRRSSCAAAGSLRMSTCFILPIWADRTCPQEHSGRINKYGLWRGGDAEPARRAMAPATAPDERVLVLVPVGGGTLDGLLDLGPGVEAPSFDGERAQHLPPRLDEVQVGRIFWLEHELPAWV